MEIFEKRKPNLFEKALLFVGILVTAVGFFLINKMYSLNQGLSWDLLITSFLWLVILLLLILTSTTQDIKEELFTIIKETKEEIKLLRKDLKRKK